MDYSEAWKARQKSGFNIGDMFGNIHKFYTEYNAGVPEYNRQLELRNKQRANGNAPVRPSQPTNESSGDINRSGVTPVKAPGAASPSYYEAVKRGPDGKRTPSSGNAGSGDNAGYTNTRDVPRVSPTGVAQKGTQTSPASTPINMDKGFDTLLAEMGLTNYYNGTAFTSHQLPTTGSNPFSANQPPMSEGFNVDAPGITGNTYDNYGSKGGASAASQQLIDGNEKFNPTAPSLMGGSTAASDESKGYKTITAEDPIASEAFGKDWVESNKGKASSMVVDSPELREMRARSAFLDAEDSMTGLKRAQAVRGVVYAGGQHYIKDGDGKKAISTDEARSINSGKISAEDFLQKRKDELTASGVQKPAEIGDTGKTPQQAAESGAFKQDKPIVATNNPNPGPAIDFNNNNQKGFPGINDDTDLLGGSRVNMPMNRNIWGG